MKRVIDTANRVIITTQDVEPILEENHRLRGEPQRSDWGRHVARIPNVTLCRWLQEEYARGHFIRAFGPEMDELVERKLKDPEWAKLKVDK